MTVIGKYTISKSPQGFRITWIENNIWNTLFSKDFDSITLVINRIV